MWDFLDKENYNLLYTYADVLIGKKKNLVWYSKDKEDVKNNAYYLIWFVYFYVLNCKTLEQALAQKEHGAIFKKYHLSPFLNNCVLYVGGGERTQPFYLETDIPIILEILYNRYDYLEQLVCFSNHTVKMRRKKCLETIELYKQYYNKEQTDDMVQN